MALGKLLSQGTLVAAFSLQTLLFDGRVTDTFYIMLTTWISLYLIASIYVFFSLPGEGAYTYNHRFTRNSFSDLTNRAKEELSIAFRKKTYWVIYFNAVGQLMIGVPLLPVYLTEVVNTPSEIIGSILIIKTIASMAVLLVTGLAIRKLGTIRIIKISGFLSTLSLFPWIFVPTEQFSWNEVFIFMPLLLVPLLFCSKSLFVTAVGHFAYDLIPRKDRVAVFTMSDIISSSFLQLSAIIGSWLVTLSAQGNILEFAGLAITWTSVWVLVGTVMSLALTLIFSKIIPMPK